MSASFNAEIEKIALQDVGRMRTKFAVSCGLLMIERATDKMIWVEQKERQDLPPGIMGIPKGSLSSLDKSFAHCAIREFQEETSSDNLCANNINLIAIIRNKPNNRLLYVFATVIDALPTNLKEGDEIAKICTITPNELAQLDRKKMPKELRQLTKFIQTIART